MLQNFEIMCTTFEDYAQIMCTISSILMLYCLFWNFWIKISTYKLIHTGKSNYSAKINKKQLSQLPHLPQPGKWTTASKRHQKHQKVTRTTRVSRYQKGKTNLDFTEARDSEW